MYYNHSDFFQLAIGKHKMKHYTQLSQDERYEIYEALKSNISLSQIARSLGRSISTIHREIKRNTGQRGYRPKQAQQLSKQRRYHKSSEFSEFAYAYVTHLLRCNWSPEQIEGALRYRGWSDVPCYEWIYQYVYRDKAQGGKLYLHLRSQKTYRKRGFKNNDRRGQISNRTSIHCRDVEINNRTRLGDFEADTVIGKHHKGAILTLVERKSLFIHIVYLGTTRQSTKTIDHCIVRLKSSQAYSVTFDNGKEFSEHQRLQDRGIDTYFADPYKSNQRARNENSNGLIRQYLPKSSSFDGVTAEQIQKIEDALNHRPRKTLGWLTPSEMMASYHTIALAA